MTSKLSEIRKEYTLQKLNESGVTKKPIPQLRKWLNDAIEAKALEPTAMTLATSTFEGKPSARMVLLKDLRDDGLVFFTNYESRKAKNILQNPYVALVIFWPELERQVRIEGRIEKVSAKESDEYFESRPQRSKLGAWASPQSQVVSSRKYIENLMGDFEEEFADKPIVRPENWGGYIVRPYLFEFWQGRENRLHDRIQYRLEDDEWVIERLAP